MDPFHARIIPISRLGWTRSPAIETVEKSERERESSGAAAEFELKDQSERGKSVLIGESFVLSKEEEEEEEEGGKLRDKQGDCFLW